MYRTRKNVRAYAAYKKVRPASCTFCHPTEHGNKILRESKFFRIVNNQFPYDVWDELKVSEHLLIVPKRHVNEWSKLSKPERQELMDFFVEANAQQYNIYNRCHTNSSSSIPEHMHIHLFKVGGKRMKFSFYLKNPYLAFSK